MAAWHAYTEEPWARLRYAVVADILDRHLRHLGPGLRILDVGGGDGLDSIPLAAAGHRVTILDTAAAMLDEARRRADAADAADRVTTVRGSLGDLPSGGPTYDVVLCHFVLHYLPVSEQAADLGRLATVVAPGGLLSVIAPNPAGRVLGQLVRGGPETALELLDSDTWESTTFAHSGRLIDADAVEHDLEAAGLRVLGRYGGRIANDLLTDDAAKHDPAHFAALLDLELRLCDREPFRRIGNYWQLVVRRPRP